MRCLSWNRKGQYCSNFLHEHEIVCDSCQQPIPWAAYFECYECGATWHEGCAKACDNSCPTHPDYLPVTMRNAYESIVRTRAQARLGAN